MFSLHVKQQFFNLIIYDIAYIMYFYTTFKSDMVILAFVCSVSLKLKILSETYFWVELNVFAIS